MNALDIKNRIENFNNCETQRSWMMEERTIDYENEFLLVHRIDSSNKWVGPDEMEKMWSVIFESKRDFNHLQGYKEIKKVLDINITKVKRGKLKGCFGIRIYGMKREPNSKIVKEILDFIFMK